MLESSVIRTGERRVGRSLYRLAEDAILIFGGALVRTGARD
jgi:hypothetical protein